MRDTFSTTVEEAAYLAPAADTPDYDYDGPAEPRPRGVCRPCGRGWHDECRGCGCGCNAPDDDPYDEWLESLSPEAA